MITTFTSGTYKDSQLKSEIEQIQQFDISNSTTYYSLDLDSPLSFKDWLKSSDIISPNTAYTLYLNYIVNWYKQKAPEEDIKLLIKNQYISLLKQLSISFTDNTIKEWFESLNLSNDIDLQDTIEFYSYKLYEIATKFANKRAVASDVKTKYNIIGSDIGVTKLITNFLLENFTQKEDIYHPLYEQPTIDTSPKLTDINNSISIFTKELYDNERYFDKVPDSITLPPGEPLTQNTIQLLERFGLTAQDAQWIYRLGTFPPVTPQNLGAIQIPSNYNLSTNDGVTIGLLLINLTEACMGNPLYNVSLSTPTVERLTLKYNFLTNNNWFYWPSGENILEAASLNIDPLPLSATTLIQSGATTGLTYTLSDRIFVIEKDTIKGAWASQTFSADETKEMVAVIYGKENLLFKFPYPGYGEYTETLPWTGPSLSNIDSNYRYLIRPKKKQIEQKYFNATTSSFDFAINEQDKIPGDINLKLIETSLVRSGAKPGKTYKEADNVILYNSTNVNNINDSTPDEIFTDDLEFAWLFDVTETDLSAPRNKATNIVWPLFTYETKTDIPFIPSEDYCVPISLSSIPHNRFVGARSGHGLYDSDIIYQRQTHSGNIINAAWLSGREIKHAMLEIAQQEPGADSTLYTAEISGTHQPGLYCRCFPGIPTTFVWTDYSKSINDSLIRYHDLPLSSPYRNIPHFSIHQSRSLTLGEVYSKSTVSPRTEYPDFLIGPGIGDWKTDNSRSVLFSPIGHPGDRYSEYDGMCDIIYVDHTFPEPFTFATWRDNNGNAYDNSPDFAWFRLNQSQNFDGNQPDVGWGPGRWVTTAGTDFILSAGMQYQYVRTNLNRPGTDVQLHTVPYMVIKEPYESARTQWVKAYFDGQIFFQPEEVIISDIVFDPGKFYVYDHYKVVSYCLSSVDTRGLGVTTQYPRVCSTDYQKWVPNNILESGQKLYIKWPTAFFYETPTTGRAPIYYKQSLYQTRWRVTAPGMPDFDQTGQSGEMYFFDLSAGSEPLTYLIETTAYQLSTVRTSQTVSITSAFQDSPIGSMFNISSLTNLNKILSDNFFNSAELSELQTRLGLDSVLTNTPGLSTLVEQISAKMQTGTSVSRDLAAALTGFFNFDGNMTTSQDTQTPVPVETYSFEVTCLPLTTRYITTGAKFYETVEYDTLPVDICVGLSGWDTNLSVQSTSSNHAMPFWAVNVDESTELTRSKGIPLGERIYTFEHEIILKSQPDVSPITFTKYKALDYHHKRNTPLEWREQLTYNTNTRRYRWNKLEITSELTPITSFACEAFQNIQVIPTTIPSDIVLYPPDPCLANLQQINYYALRPFTWNQPVRMSTPIRPSVPTITTSVTPIDPLASLLNRHFPTIAVTQKFNNLQTKDSIGQFVPENIGVGTYLGLSYTVALCADTNYSNVRNPLTTVSDFGITNQKNITPSKITKYDARWQKAPATLIQRSGTIFNTKQYQKFTPYINKGEGGKPNQQGISRPSDITNPWTGVQDLEFIESAKQFEDFRAIKNPFEWSAKALIPETITPYTWGTDIFGNTYCLLKNIYNIDPYSQKTIPGALWMRFIDGELVKVNKKNKDLFTFFQAELYQDILQDNIIDFAVIENVLVCVTPTGIGILEINFLRHINVISPTNIFFSKIFETGFEPLFGNILYNFQEEQILIPVLIKNIKQKTVEIQLLEFNREYKTFKSLFQNNANLVDLNVFIESNEYFDLQSPILAYSKNLNVYNLSFLSSNNTENCLISIDFKIISGKVLISKIDKLIP